MHRVARLSAVFHIAVTALAWISLLSTPPFLVWVVLYSETNLGNDVTVPAASLPLLPLVVFTTLFSLRTVLIVLALFSLRRILEHFGHGRFFTRDSVQAFRRAGLQLLALSLVNILGPVLTGLALLATEPRFAPSDVWLLLTEFPFTSLLGGLFALIMAHVLGQAADLAEDAALTV